MSRKPPMSLDWVDLFVQSLLVDIDSWELISIVDPLCFFIHVVFTDDLADEESRNLREVVKMWCVANNAVYNKSHWKGRQFRAKVFIRGRGPRQFNYPY